MMIITPAAGFTTCPALVYLTHKRAHDAAVWTKQHQPWPQTRGVSSSNLGRTLLYLLPNLTQPENSMSLAVIYLMLHSHGIEQLESNVIQQCFFILPDKSAVQRSCMHVQEYRRMAMLWS